MEEAKPEADSKELEQVPLALGGAGQGMVPSLSSQCCAFLRMKSFEELGRELGREKLMDSEPAGTESSSAGKMRRRSGGRLKSWVDVMAGRDYLGR